MKQVPRYTSYPTAPHFHDGIQAETYVSWLRTLNPDHSVSLYFHIPFCHQLCWFCGCHTKVVNQYRPVSSYLDVLRKEVEILSPFITKASVSQIHFGGGSPSIISPDDFREFMHFLRTQFRIKKEAEIALELDPRTCDEDKISAYTASGVNRVSIGAQDFSENVQRAINRVQPYNVVEKTVRQLRSRGVKALNIDLIYGLPHQSLETIKGSIEKTAELAPDRVALFGYAHVPWMRKHQQLINENLLPGEESRAEMREYAGRLLQEAGYVPIGIDHFAREGDPLATALEGTALKRNFQGYTTDDCEFLIGLGASSISSLPQGYAQNNADIIGYRETVLNGELPILRGVELSDEDKERRIIIMSLMCAMPVEVPMSIYSAELEKLTPYVNRGVVAYDGTYLSVDPKAHDDLRLIASIFDQYLPGTQNLHSQAV